MQARTDKQIAGILADSVKLADDEMAKLEKKQNIGSRIRKTQMLASKSVILEVIHKAFLEVGNVIRADQATAAALASDLLFKDELKIWETVQPTAKDVEAVREQLRSAAARNVQAMMTRILQTEQPLSRRVYKSEALARGQVHRVVNKNVALGRSVAELARDVRDLIDPSTPGGVSYRAKTLARTEVVNAFHAQSINDMQERPWIDQAQWNLSKSRNEQNCACEDYARTRFFPVDQVPKKPHPGCLCTVTPKLPDIDTAMKAYLSGQYSPWLPGVV